MSQSSDPFKNDRNKHGLKWTKFNGEEIPFVLRLKDLRKTVKDWQTYSSDHPFKVVPHTEEKMRSMRQIPIEMDPPDHTDYRALVEPFFKRPNTPEYITDMEELISSMMTDVLATDQVDAVHEFAPASSVPGIDTAIKCSGKRSGCLEGMGIACIDRGRGTRRIYC